MFALQGHQIHDIDHSDLQTRKVLSKYGNGSEDLQRRCISATRHDHIRLGVLIVARPLPDANALRTMHNSRFDAEPLG